MLPIAPRTSCDGFDARIFQKPLLAQARLDRHIGALAEADVVLVRLLFHQRAEFLQLLHGHLARFETIQPGEVRRRRDRSSCRSGS